MKNAIDRKTIGKLLLVVLAIVAFFYVNYNFTFNFVALFVALLGFMTLPLWLNERPKRFLEDPQTGEKTMDYVRNSNGAPVYNGSISYKYAFAILVFGCLALYALGNYFNAHNNVYYNYDHHALRVDGVRVEQDKEFVLAASDRDAFLDVPTINGEVIIESYDSTGVKLRLKGLTTPIYMKEYDDGELEGYDCVNDLEISFRGSAYPDSADRVEIVFSEEHSVSFAITEIHEKALLYPNDNIRCDFTEGEYDGSSSFTTFIRHGYSLEGMAADVPLKADLSGINVVRSDVIHNCKRRILYEKYSVRPYYIELENGHSVQSIKIYGKDSQYPEVMNVSELESKETTLTMDYGKPFYIGSGENKSESVKFALAEDGTLHVLYELPKYQRLASADGSLESTVMVTSTLVNPNAHSDGDSGLIENLTDNVLLFDVFNNHDNAFNIVPFYVSYMGGPTNERMQFVVMTPEGGVNPYQAYLGKDSQYFAGVKSKNDTEWLVQVEDFKSTSPFRSTTLAWVLFACIALCAASIIYSGKNFLYTGVEYAAYLILIAFLSIRFFLMWRVTVFPPLATISWYEFEHFRDVRWITIVFMGLGILFSIINLTKVLLLSLRRRNMKIQDWLYANRGWFIALALILFCVGIKIITKKWLYTGLAAVAILAAVILMIRKRSKLPGKVIGKICTPGGIFGLITAAAAMVFAIAKLSSSPVLTVLFPVFSYLLIDALIYGLFSKTYLEDFMRDRDLVAVGERATAFSLSVWNMLCISVVTLLSDGGYGVMFTMFMLFSLWFKIADLYQYTRYDKESKSVANVAFMALFVILTLIVVFYKRLFLMVINSFADGKAWLVIILACLVLFLMALCVLLVLDQDFRSIMKFVRKRYVAISVVSVITAGLLTLVAIVGQDKITGSHMQFRSRVHLENAGYILSTIQNTEDQNKFMQASLNDWILYEYERIGDDVRSFGEQGNGYFKLQPQSKLGAMWFAQTTDICVSRYIIAEHGKALAWLFVAAFAMLLFIALREVSGYRWSRIVFVQVALLFAVQALMILLANTRAFIFFGQDFPLISITSRLSSLYFFMLMMLCVSSAIMGRDKYRKDYYDNLQLDSRLHVKNLALRNNIMLFFIISSLALYGIGKSDRNLGDGASKKDKTEQTESKAKSKSMLSEKELRKVMDEDARKSRRNSGKQAKKDSTDTTMKWLNDIAFYKDGKYDVDTLLKVMNAELETIVNPAFRNYQEKVSGTPRLQRNMSAFVAEVMADKIYMDTALIRCSDFTRIMLQRYNERYSKDNSVRSLICLRNVRSFEFQRKKGTRTYNVVPKNMLEFCTSLDYFKYELPRRETDRWDGHVVEVVRDNFSDTACMASGKGWSAAYIPGNLTADGKPVQIVKPVTKRGFDLVGVNALLSVRPDDPTMVNAVNVSQHDFLIAKERIIDGLPLDQYNYIARNILLNGKRTFIYPNGKKMFWAREFTASKMKKLRAGDPNVELAISTELSNSLYDVYASEVGANSGRHDDRCVICADGDGHIVARVDYRSDTTFRLNPNDFKEIAKISEFLSQNKEKGRTTESRFFGSFSHNALRRGPGSTQKPIVWTAVTSMYNTGWWDDLKMAPIPLKFKGSPENNSYYYFKQYAGHRLESPFQSLMSDEGYGASVDLRKYMYKSSNYYNSIMAYLGTYTAEDLAEASDVFRDSKDYVAAVEGLKEPSAKSYRRKDQYEKAMRKYNGGFAKNSDAVIGAFPTVYLDKKDREPKTFDRFLTQSMVMDTTALLPKGLSENFGLRPIDYEPMSKRPYQYFNMSIRAGKKADAQLNEYAVRSVAIGNNSAWIVSPDKMTEMYGRLVGLNKNYTLSMESKVEQGKHSKNEYEMFDLDESWKGTLSSASRNYADARKDLLVGMSYVFRYIGDRHPLNGTASSIFKLKTDDPGYYLGMKDGKKVYLVLDSGDEEQDSHVHKFYVYGKTGTIDGYWGGLKGEDHMLATIITDRPLSSCKDEDDFEAVKFYVIYQVDYNYMELKKYKKDYKEWAGVDRKIIETVIKSNAFKDYMGLK